MLFGLIELDVDLTDITAPYETDAVLQGVRRDAGRADRVRAAADHARRIGCRLIVFPGWTVVADEPPDWLLALSADATVVFETLRPAASAPASGKRKGVPEPPPAKGAALPSTDSAAAPGPVWLSYVIQGGRVVVGPAPQRVASAGDLWDGDDLSPHGAALVRELQAAGPAGRRWSMPGIGESMLLICGEANVVAGGRDGCWNASEIERAGLTDESLRAVRLVVNPAHTLTSLPAMRYKRAWLSRGGVLLHTANTHTSWLRDDGAGRGDASRTAAQAWLRGEPCELVTHPGDGYALKTLEWEP